MRVHDELQRKPPMGKAGGKAKVPKPPPMKESSLLPVHPSTILRLHVNTTPKQRNNHQCHEPMTPQLQQNSLYTRLE
jgi:hypothetical protein